MGQSLSLIQCLNTAEKTETLEDTVAMSVLPVVKWLQGVMVFVGRYSIIMLNKRGNSISVPTKNKLQYIKWDPHKPRRNNKTTFSPVLTGSNEKI